MKSRKTILVLLVVQIVTFALYGGVKVLQAASVENVAQQMRDNGSKCQCLSAEEMRDVRWQFLHNNPNSTIADLVKALGYEIEGQDIIEYLKSLNCPACSEHANVLQKDKDSGIWAVRMRYGDSTVEEFINRRFLKK